MLYNPFFFLIYYFPIKSFPKIMNYWIAMKININQLSINSDDCWIYNATINDYIMAPYFSMEH